MRSLRLVGLASLSLLLTAQVPTTTEETRVVVMVDREKGVTVYRVNSAPVSLSRLGAALENVYDPKAPDRPVFVLFHLDTPLRLIINVGANLAKVGFDRVSYYYFGDSKSDMQQVEFGQKVLKFSPSGPQPPYDDIRMPQGPPR